MNKDEMVSKVTKEVEAQEKNLENLKAKAEAESGELLADIKKVIDDLEVKVDQGKDKLAEIIDTADDQWDDIVDSMEEGWEEFKNSFEDGWDTVNDTISQFFSDGTKEEFLKKAQESIDDQEQNLLQLKDKIAAGADELGDELLEDYQKAVDALESKIEEAKGKFSEIADTADHRWEYMKNASEKTWDEVKGKFDEGIDSFADSVKKLFSS